MRHRRRTVSGQPAEQDAPSDQRCGGQSRSRLHGVVSSLEVAFGRKLLKKGLFHGLALILRLQNVTASESDCLKRHTLTGPRHPEGNSVAGLVRFGSDRPER
jgi:hypothetical protein